MCGNEIPPRRGPGRPAAYCADPGHNPVRAHRAARRYAAEAQASIEQDDAGRLAAELKRSRAIIAAAERARHGAEREAHAARRERDAALALRDLAIDDAAEARTEAAEAVSRMRRQFDREVASLAAVADAEIARATSELTLGPCRPRLTA
ncbi:hypothetical protein IU438_28645 [Nocardia cyriacigeorgica]|uniref:hypothetical protein n=1 Tax=Nocardia cyriacigeorgica TaxID=135487 RepID=UPI001892D7F8|nr:hypothetical protein [Nocardia cyriacigeorgica]MBF6399741.1 hypothetical protein [Nocardia cyriacigeorgica]MBF6405430.1 hypothetical protein [Nocardia cyriacigeorgica]